MPTDLHVGDLLGHDHYGCPRHDVFGGGYFDDDYDGPFRVEAIGADWVIARGQGGRAHAHIGNPSDLNYLKVDACPMS